MKRYFLSVIAGMCVIVVLIVIVTFMTPSSTPVLHPLQLHAPSGQAVSLNVEWATTAAEQEKGLMGRAQVDHGMLFLFGNAQPLTFWMKNTLVPLDIVFFDANGVYVSSTTMQPCTADPCALYPSGGPAEYALEMPAGFVQQTGIGKDWKMDR